MNNPIFSANANLAHYRIISKMGAGEMGEVYLAEDTRLDRKVALKILPADLPPITIGYGASNAETVPQTSRSDTRIRQCMHGMQRMHVHFF